MNKFFLPILCIQVQIGVTAQVLHGIIRDSKTDKALPYVHIGVPNKNMGTISHEDGRFSIDLSKADRDDSIFFSRIGYAIEKKQIKSIILSQETQIKLVEKPQQLMEVVVRPDKPKTTKLGRFTPSKITIGHSLTKEFGLGGEWGLKISNHGKKYWIDNIQFHMRFNTVDSILFRIQIYSIKDDVPDKSLLSHETFVSSRANQHWIVRNLEKEYLILDQDVIITYEVIRVYFSKKGDNEIFFTYGKGYEEGKIYSRASSFDAWKIGEPAPKAIPVAMFMTVSEY
ncbi:MAG: carboxypeptidase-like regulatory domain-containing protein [Bacteroidetes bacterium]|nr:carboxypeptidase-like regulatory domain-containing protein [Bacteroidota bacterium]